jgi:bacterioferritin
MAREFRMTTAPFLSDLARIRGRMRQHSVQGAAAAGSAARRDTVLQLLNDILASELIWLMRYRRRYLLWDGMREVSDERARTEPTPADPIVRRILELGGDPDLDPDHLLSRKRADYASHGSVGDRIREDLCAERIVIESYVEAIDFLGAADPATRAMLEVNLGSERARAAQLAEILRDVEAESLDRVG